MGAKERVRMAVQKCARATPLDLAVRRYECPVPASHNERASGSPDDAFRREEAPMNQCIIVVIGNGRRQSISPTVHLLQARRSVKRIACVQEEAAALRK